MAFNNTGLPRSAHPKILAHLRTLRGSIARARDALMHYREDRVDRDKLEPAARRVDDLMNMFATAMRDPEKGSLWITEVLGGIDLVTNPKAAAALREARAEATVLLDMMGSEVKAAASRAG